MKTSFQKMNFQKLIFRKKLLCGLLIAFAFAVFFVPFASANIITKINDSTSVPTVYLGKSFNLNSIEVAIPLTDDLVVASAKLKDDDVNTFPFNKKTSYFSNQEITEPTLPNTSYKFYTISFDTETLNVSAGATVNKVYKIPIEITFNKLPLGSGTEIRTVSLSVKVEPPEPTPAPTPPIIYVTPEPTPEPTPVSIPKVIVSGFRTEPAQVVAGEEFVLYLTYKNTSTTGNISNFKISLTSDGTFNAVSGSLTSFISNIVAGESQTTSIALMPKADTAPGSYNVNLALNYDAAGTFDNTPVTDTEVIAIPVEQIPEAKLQQIEIVPEAPFVGQDFNLMCSVNNTGKSTLYNVTATVSADGEYIDPQELYLGNIESGSTGNVDIYATPLKEGMANVKLTLTYEDEKGKVFDLSDTKEVYISTYMPPDIGPEIMPPEQEGGSIVPWVVAIILLLVGGGVTAIILVKRKNKKIKAARDREIARQIEQQMIYQNQGYNTGDVNSGYINNNGIYNNGNNGNNGGY